MKCILLLLSIYIPSSIAANTVDTGACFFRYEDNGILNVRPTHISVDGKNAATLEGGGFQCLALSVGRHSIYAYSSDPYDPHNKNENAWRSKELSIQVETGMVTYVRIVPKSKDAAYTGPWLLYVTPHAPDMSQFSE